MAKPPSAESILKNMKNREQKFEPKTPIATDMFIPNHSGITSHPEYKNDDTFLAIDGSNANQNIDIGTYDFTTTGNITAQNGTFSSAISPVTVAERTSNLTMESASSWNLKHTTTADMINGFGSSLAFIIRDSAGTDNYIATIGAVRDGADNSGKINFKTFNAGSSVLAGSIDSSQNWNFNNKQLSNINELSLGNGTATDFSFKVNASANDGELTWDEDRGSWRVGSGLNAQAKIGIGETTSSDIRLWVNTDNTDISASRYAAWFRARKTTTTSDNNLIYGFLNETQTFGTGNHTNTAHGGYMSVTHVGSGTLSSAFGIRAQLQNFNGVAGTISDARGFVSELDAEDGTITSGYNFYGKTPLIDGGNIVNFAHIWLEDFNGADTNNWGVVVDSNNIGVTLGATQQATIKYDGTDLDFNISSGVMKFGTHSAITTENLSGYITIKDSAGNTRKLAVVS